MQPVPAHTVLDTDNPAFQQAVAFVTHTNENLFLTGKAGAGKTTFLKYIVKHSGKQCAVVAPTGVAAMNAGGETIHSLLQLPFGPFVPVAYGGFAANSTDALDKHTLLEKLKMRGEKIKLLRRLELLIVDEVSMVRADVLDAMDLVLRHVRRNHHMPFGGLQVVLIGDAFQLPPVVREEEWYILREYYPGPYFFDSAVLRQHMPVYIELKKIYRQKDERFIGLLNRVRNGNVTETDLVTLNHRYDPSPDQEGYIVLCTHNRIADEINRHELEKLDTPLQCFTGTVTGEVNLRSLPAEQELQLKKGAQVMFIKNDLQTPRRFYNGKMGKVSALGTGEIWVSFPDSPEPVQVPLEVWKSVRYTLNRQTGRVEEEETGSFTQFPLRLAWAVTVHKSQGLTLDRVIVDLGRAFAPGQVYVALSRCTSLEGIILRAPLQEHNILVDDRVVEFSGYEMDEEDLQATLEVGEKKARLAAWLKVFSFADLIDEVATLQPEFAKRKTGPKKENAELLDWLANELETARVNADKFGLQLASILQQGDKDRQTERLAAARIYFTAQVLTPCISRITDHLAWMEDIPKTAKQKKQWGELQLKLKNRLMQILSSG